MITNYLKSYEDNEVAVIKHRSRPQMT